MNCCCDNKFPGSFSILAWFEYFCKVKLLSYIFAVYLILLSAIPCCTFDNCDGDKSTEALTKEKEEKDNGNCSPFFSCEGCATASISTALWELDFFSPPLISVFPNHLQQQLSKAEYDFWQPPKIG